MDVQTIGIAKALIYKALPKTTAADEGKQIIVDGEGGLVAGNAVDAAIAVDGHTLKIIIGGE